MNSRSARYKTPGASLAASIPGQKSLPAAALAHIGRWLLTLLLVGCASYSGSSLKPGSASLADVVAVMGSPAMQWTNADRSVQLSYPRGPAGFHSYMVYLDAGGRLERIENVMDGASFARVKADLTKDDVLRILGPSFPGWSVYFPARRELAWEWRYCNGRGTASRFDVLFDNDTGRVRSTMSLDEVCAEEGCRCSN
jgi:hypothetical protein